MSFEKLKNFWRGSNYQGKEESLFQQAQNLITLTIKKSQPNISQFNQYITNISSCLPRKAKQPSKTNLTNSTYLKPQLLKRCYENVDTKYFNQNYTIKDDIFTRNKKINQQIQIKMHQDLDEVQICLFNQISSRFDEILSVLRTIESLECIVDDNLSKIKLIRSKNIKLSKDSSSKQRNVVSLINKRNNLEKALNSIKLIKLYNDFKKSQVDTIQINDQTYYYSRIQQIKKQYLFYNKIKCTQDVNQRIDQYEGALKKSFSDNINDMVFRYITELIGYQKSFWSKMSHRMDIFEEEIKDGDGTVILDQSAFIQEEHIVLIKLINQREQSILDNLKRGWNDGQYTVGGLKAKLDSFLKNFHNGFLQDYRNFCLQMCQRFQKKVDNPSLSNLLQIMTVNFITKVSQYFNDAHKNLLERTFSTINKCLQYLVDESVDGDKTIQQKQKLKIIFDGLMNTQAFILKILTDKIVQVLDSKAIQDTTGLLQFKTIIGVLQTQQEFINKKLVPLVQLKFTQQTFLKQQYQILYQRLNLNSVTKIKEQKLFNYLSKMHKFVLQSELKDNLQNQIWQPIDIPTYYYDSLHYLISGQSLNLRRNRFTKNSTSFNGSMMFDSSVWMDSIPYDHNSQNSKSTIGNFRIIRNQIIIQGKIYKITQTLLLIIQILEDYLNLVHSYPLLKKQVALKINELIRSYNSSSCQLIVNAGAVVLGKIKTKNITAKHLALSSVCLNFLIYLLQCILKRVQVQEASKLFRDINDHINQIIKKLKTILISKVSQSLSQINLDSSPSKGTQVIISNTKKLHDILIDYYQKPTLKQVFTQQAVRLYVDRTASLSIKTRLSAQALKDDISFYFNELRFLNDLIHEFNELRVQAEDTVRKAFQSL